MVYGKSYRKYLAISKSALREQIAYWQEVGARTFFFAIILFTFSGLWEQVVGDGALAGFTRPQLVWYLTLTEIITLSSTSLLTDIEADVKSGQIAYLLLRPFNYLLYQAAHYSGEMLVSIGLNALAGGTVAWILVGLPQVGWQSLVQTGLLMVIGAAVRFCLLTSIALCSFFVEESRPFYWIYSKMTFTLGGLFLPIDLYPKFFRQVAGWLPFQSVAYSPARAFITEDRAFFLAAAGRGLMWLVLLAGLLIWQYSQGVKHINVNGG